MEPDAYCLHQHFEPAGPFAFRTDRHYLIYALEGTIRLEAEGRRWTLPPARAALIAADRPITIAVLSRLVSASVLFSPAVMPAPAAALTVFDVSPLARELIRECRHWGPESGELSAYARQVFLMLATVVSNLAATPSPCVMPAPKSASLARALVLTEERAHGAPTFAAIARETGQSPRVLARRFADEMGMTWREALRRIRIIRAVEALATTDDTVTDICLAVGYTSTSAFNSAFRTLTGLSPSDYRSSFKG